MNEVLGVLLVITLFIYDSSLSLSVSVKVIPKSVDTYLN